MPLTDTFVRQAKYSGNAAGDKHSGDGGMYLLVNAVGKYWRLHYRFSGKQKTLALGVCPAVSLAAARRKRDQARELLPEGKDPSLEKQEAAREVKRASASYLRSLHVIGWHSPRVSEGRRPISGLLAGLSETSSHSSASVRLVAWARPTSWT